MISRIYIKCLTCNKPHMLRIQIGHSLTQTHHINCVNCKEPIKFSLDLDQKNAGISFNTLINCEETSEIEGATPYYVSSDIAVDSSKIHDEQYFPSLQTVRYLMNHPKGKRYFRDSSMPRAGMVDELWADVQRIWRLNNSRGYAIANRIIDELCKKHEIERPILREVLFWFNSGLFENNASLNDHIEKISAANRSEFLRLAHYYCSNLREHHRRSLFEIYSKFFAAFSDFSQVFVYVRIGESLSDHLRVTSINFEAVQRFYAEAYEFFASFIVVYACINNISEGRKFDEFKNITLKRYLTTDKAKRRDAFLECEVFVDASKEFDSDIRNASFHNWFFLSDDHSTIKFRPGGAGAEQTLSYCQYLQKCVSLFKQIVDLFSFTLRFDEIVNATSVVEDPHFRAIQRVKRENERVLLSAAGFTARPALDIGLAREPG